MFCAFLYNGQTIFGSTEWPEEGKTVLTNPMTIMTMQQPGQPPMAMVVPMIPGDPSRVTNVITFNDSALARIEGSFLEEAEKKYIEATSRIQLAGHPHIN